MTVKEIINEIYVGSDIQTYEVWKYTDKTRRLHTDFIQNIESEYGFDEYCDLDAQYYVMDETEYNNTICCNSSVKAAFEEWYGNKDAKILVITV